MSSQNSNKPEPESTTVVGLKSEDGVVICADRQVSGKRRTTTDKIKEIHPNAVVGTAGKVTDIQTLIKDVKSGVKEYRVRRGRDMTLRALFEYVREVVNPGAGLTVPNYLSNIVIGGYHREEPMLAEISFFGTKSMDNYVSVGSGEAVARGVIADEYEEEIGLNQARDLAVRSVEVAANEGVFTGEGIDICVISEDGIEINRLDI
jgi:proteasome beta subunit